jgi:hypothetical protein
LGGMGASAFEVLTKSPLTQLNASCEISGELIDIKFSRSELGDKSTAETDDDSEVLVTNLLMKSSNEFIIKWRPLNADTPPYYYVFSDGVSVQIRSIKREELTHCKYEIPWQSIQARPIPVDCLESNLKLRALLSLSARRICAVYCIYMK